ncbi:hypothetical protein ABZV31_37660 [Streptomyces sp. NPDC005202]|uniref:hypothetical protein n=1 Tax=Streptomyces sp. NPDC005202 TaxID=3157021 RepID=UPI0033B9361D
MYYYWNRNGVDTTRTVDLDVKEGTPLNIKACLGDWSGTATGGIRWDKCSDWEQTDA